MKRTTIAVTVLALLGGGAGLVAAEAPRLAFHEQAERAVGDVVETFRSLGAQLERHLRGDRGPRELSIPRTPRSGADRPLISYMLDHRSELGLSPEQVSRLETLRGDFTREAIRREADLRVAELDLQQLMDQELLDISKVEAKLHEVARLHTDLRVARLRTIEQGKAVLTPEQRSRLRAMLGTLGEPRRTAQRTTL
ncbi:MAG: Spy/CpxP family protein refolding chaperone [Candidatus Rokuibacteriota bacterium]